MKKLLLLLLIPAAIFSCAPSTRIEKSWRDPNTSIVAGSWNKVLVVGLLKDETTRRVVEDQLVARFKGKGVPSYTYFTDKEVTEAKSSGFKDKLVTDGFDGAVIQAGLVDQLNLCVADFIIGARPVFGGGGRGSVGTANG